MFVFVVIILQDMHSVYCYQMPIPCKGLQMCFSSFRLTIERIVLYVHTCRVLGHNRNLFGFGRALPPNPVQVQTAEVFSDRGVPPNVVLRDSGLLELCLELGRSHESIHFL